VTSSLCGQSTTGKDFLRWKGWSLGAGTRPQNERTASAHQPEPCGPLRTLCGPKTGRGTAPRGGPVQTTTTGAISIWTRCGAALPGRVLAEIAAWPQPGTCGLSSWRRRPGMRRFAFIPSWKLSPPGLRDPQSSKNHAQLSAHKIHAHLADLGLVPDKNAVCPQAKKNPESRRFEQAISLI